MTNTIETIKRPINQRINDVRMDFNLKRSDISELHDSGLVTTRIGVHRRAMEIIEEQAALIKQMREALKPYAHTDNEMVKFTKGFAANGNEVADTPANHALELLAEYEELEDL